jgi:hypothetical protein
MSTPTIDFARPQRVPALGWCLLAAGAGALAIAAWWHHRWDTERAAQEASLLEQETAQRLALEAAHKSRTPTVDERRWQRLTPQLQQRWLPVLRTIEGATESPVFLLALSIDPASGRVQLDGEAPSFDEALAYVQRLSGDGPLAGVHLASHEASTNTGRASVHFTVLARWTPP